MKRQRGIFRLWVLGSIIWIAFWSWRRDLICELDLPHFGSGPWCFYQSWDVAFHVTTAVLLLGPPALFGLIGWVAMAFISDEHKSN